ncbi:MAG: hypothetical protein K1X78_00565 [Verrucomicrobiaceae bacterium]|nr:hypothetical protein [Verrucomicrobiaceae bacterium]
MNTAPQSPPLWKRAVDFWLAHEPVRHARWEIVMLRFVLALLFWDIHASWVPLWREPSRAVMQMVSPSSGTDLKYQSLPHPNGFASFVDLSFLANDAVEQPLRMATAASLVLFVLGVPAAFTLAIPALFGIGVTTVINSQGAIAHNAQGLQLVLLCMWLAGLWSWWCKSRGRPLPWEFTPAQLELDWARQGLMAAYVTSAVTKIVNSDGNWLSDARFFPLHMAKNNDMEFYDTLNAAALKMDWLPQVLMDHPGLCIFFFGLALPLELLAFLGLYNRRIALLFGLGLIGFHETVSLLTHLAFIFNKLLLLILFVSPQWWIVQGCKKLTHRNGAKPA